ncbi:MAG TPA: CDP-glucose 4,6-dehydratase [Planctomycetales bacterium]|jgi:CDP-glucose 4,6-dehydratase|nr:CDP-glucose 4,6-dehydratase [Planctomycetales bacterium]
MTQTLAHHYHGRTVLVTGHTGFKGSWLCLWLRELGARVVGFSLAPPTEPSHYRLLDLDVESFLGDVRDAAALRAVVERCQPSAVFHLAAQPLVRLSYREPVETLTTNVLGTVNVYEACRAADCVRAIVSITSDKAYQNRESATGYRETDPVGGSDPYSCSKGCAELITSCYRASYFPAHGYGSAHRTLLASARAGNVIGGGDWAEDRLIPDAVKAAARGEPVPLRNPRSVRPWQHVLEPLAGYLLLGARLLEGRPEFAEAWNFGPDAQGEVEVEAVVAKMQESWPALCYYAAPDASGPHETKTLKLDSGKARDRLGWRPVWDWVEAVERTALWYRRYHETGAVRSREDLAQYTQDALRRGCEWVAG